MSRPSRIPNKLPLDKITVYFITICVAKRLKVLDDPRSWDHCRKTIVRLNRWFLIGALAMPDHIHFLTSPYDRNESPQNYSKWFKRGFNGPVHRSWTWQEGSFDHLLRSMESAQQKWEYIRNNPVRAGLVSNPDDWPYQPGFMLPKNSSPSTSFAGGSQNRPTAAL